MDRTIIPDSFSSTQREESAEVIPTYWTTLDIMFIPTLGGTEVVDLS